MAMPSGSVFNVRSTTSLFDFDALESLQCGCVAACYRARPWDIAVVLLEAKGPHCILAGHAEGQIVRLGDPLEAEGTGEEFEE